MGEGKESCLRTEPVWARAVSMWETSSMSDCWGSELIGGGVHPSPSALKKCVCSSLSGVLMSERLVCQYFCLFVCFTCWVHVWPSEWLGFGVENVNTCGASPVRTFLNTSKYTQNIRQPFTQVRTCVYTHTPPFTNPHPHLQPSPRIIQLTEQVSPAQSTHHQESLLSSSYSNQVPAGSFSLLPSTYHHTFRSHGNNLWHPPSSCTVRHDRVISLGRSRHPASLSPISKERSAASPSLPPAVDAAIHHPMGHADSSIHHTQTSELSALRPKWNGFVGLLDALPLCRGVYGRAGAPSGRSPVCVFFSFYMYRFSSLFLSSASWKDDNSVLTEVCFLLLARCYCL